MCPSPQRRLAGLRRERVEARQISTLTSHLDPSPPTLVTAHQMSTHHQPLLVAADRRPLGRPRGSSNVGPHRPGDVQLALSRSLSTSGAPRGPQFVLPFAPPRFMDQVLTSPLFWSNQSIFLNSKPSTPFLPSPVLLLYLLFLFIHLFMLHSILSRPPPQRRDRHAHPA